MNEIEWCNTLIYKVVNEVVMNKGAGKYQSWLLGTISPVPVCCSWTVSQWDFQN
jgi:hypothetical protein